MASEIEFQSICNQSIFGEEFQKLTERKRGKITFKKIPNAPGGIAVVYAPNGTGKTSLSKALANQEDTEGLGFTALYNHKTITPQIMCFE